MDRFGVSWQVMAAPGVERATVAPCLMVTGPQHGRFSLAGQPLVAMDGAFEHGFTFSQAVSLQVMRGSGGGRPALGDVGRRGASSAPAAG